jgi:hypothetical protein
MKSQKKISFSIVSFEVSIADGVNVNLAYGVVLAFLFSVITIEIFQSSTSTHLNTSLSRFSDKLYSSLIAFLMSSSSNFE